MSNLMKAIGRLFTAKHSSDAFKVNGENIIPMGPSQQWLEDNGWEFVDFRDPKKGEMFITKNFQLDIYDGGSCDSQWGGKRWIVKPKLKKEIDTPLAENG